MWATIEHNEDNENDTYHIVKVMNGQTFEYKKFTRIERHDDSCTYVEHTH